jgi:limonene-1,2-epoxide hydrolase
MKPTRRNALTTAGLGVAAFAGPLKAATGWTPAEKANVDAVTAFCAAWPSHDVAKIMSFFADPCAYRVTETQDPAKGREAVTARIAGFVDRVQEFKVLATFAKGPMVFNERIDSFASGALRSWHGVGVFFLKDGKIVEWYDYTILADRR